VEGDRGEWQAGGTRGTSRQAVADPT